MEALTPASPDSLPPLGEMIADEPFRRYPASAAGRALPTCFTGHQVGRSALEEAFAAWLATYRDGELGSTLASYLLTVGHLLAAFAAGWEAVAGYQDSSESLMS